MKKGFKVFCMIAAFMALYFTSTAFAACNVSATPVTFGSYNVFSAAPLDSAGRIIVFCTRNVRVEGSIGPSPNSGGFDPRMMKLTTGADLMEYNLYTDKIRTRIWGDGSGNTYTRSGQIRRFRPLIVNVYGRIPPLQDVAAGSYSETLTVTITW